MAQVTKKYRLKQGHKHRVPNPNFTPGVNEPEESHFEVTGGALVDLTDAQYKSFHDKFFPAESSASSVRDDDVAELEDAKEEALRTGNPVNPNTQRAPS